MCIDLFKSYLADKVLQKDRQMDGQTGVADDNTPMTIKAEG